MISRLSSTRDQERSQPSRGQQRLGGTQRGRRSGMCRRVGASSPGALRAALSGPWLTFGDRTGTGGRCDRNIRAFDIVNPPPGANGAAPSFLRSRVFDFTCGSGRPPKSPRPLRRVLDSLEALLLCPLVMPSELWYAREREFFLDLRTILSRSHRTREPVLNSAGNRRLRAATDFACAPAADLLSASIIGAANEIKRNTSAKRLQRDSSS